MDDSWGPEDTLSVPGRGRFTPVRMFPKRGGKAPISVWTDANGALAAQKGDRDLWPPRRVSVRTGVSLGSEGSSGMGVLFSHPNKRQTADLRT